MELKDSKRNTLYAATNSQAFRDLCAIYNIKNCNQDRLISHPKNSFFQFHQPIITNDTIHEKLKEINDVKSVRFILLILRRDQMGFKSLINRNLIEVPEAGYFRFLDVVGDNNCFFNALCVCPAIKYEDPRELRTSLADFIQHSMEARRVYTDILHGRIPFDSFVKRLRKNGTWQGTEAAVFISMMCSLNIVIVSNSQAGIFSDNIRLWKNIDFIEEDAPTIYLYYHLHKKPFTPSSKLNHYGYLSAYDGSNPKGYNIYRNSRNDTSEPSTIDLSRYGATKGND